MAGVAVSEQESTVSLPAAFSGVDSGKLWRNSAPEEVRSLWKGGSKLEAWEEYRRQLSRDVSKDSVKTAFSRLGYGLLADSSEFVRSILKSAKRGKLADLDGAATDWLDSLNKPSPGTITPTSALDALTWANVIAYAPTSLPVELWLQILDAVSGLAIETAGSKHSIEDMAADRVVVENLLAGELALTLANSLGDLRPLHSLRDSASESLSESLTELCDGQGVLTAKLLGIAPVLFGCWTRCRLIGEASRGAVWSKDAQTQYEWLLRHLLRLSDESGQLPLTRAGSIEDALAEALAIDGDEADDAAGERRLRFDLDAEDDDPPEPSAESEWAECAVLGAGWSPKSPVIAVTWDRPTMRLAIRSDKRVLIEGDWPIVVRRNGQLLTATDEWDSQCWYSDEDCDYLELSTELHDGVRLERQIVLGRQNGVVAIGELITGGGEEAGWEVETRLQMGGGVTFSPEAETFDGVLTAGKAAAAIFPCSLPEWRIERGEGDLSADNEGNLVQATIARGRNLSSLMWIDLSPKRFGKQRTWRRLTVAQSLERVTRDVAVGYRVQSGKEQWLYYRSIDAAANRTVLGQNLSSESLVGRFLPTGEVDEYFEIEADD